MKNNALFVVSFILCLLLVGCVAKPSNEPEKSTSQKLSTTSEVVSTTKGETEKRTEKETEIQKNEDDDELFVLRNKIKKANCVLGVAFVDYEDSGLSLENTQIYINQSETVKKYPFLRDIKTVSYDGMELFIFVPASKESVITIYPNNITDSGEYQTVKDKVIYKSKPGESVALRCNTNENYSNVVVCVKDGEKDYEFYPMISLADGWSVALADGCYDFSVENILKYSNDACYLLPKTYPEIQELIDNGNELVFAGSFYFCDEMMLRFEVGEYTDESYSKESFVCKKQYAVAYNATYAMDPKDHKWYVIGNGLGDMGLLKKES